MKHTQHWVTELQIVQTRQSKNNVNSNTWEDNFFSLRVGGLRFFFRDVIVLQVGRYTAFYSPQKILLKILPADIGQTAHLPTQLFIIRGISDVSHASISINKHPHFCHSPSGATGLLRRLVCQNRKPGAWWQSD